MPGFDTILAGLDKLERDIEAALLRGVATELPGIASDLAATDRHGDITGATRAGYYADAATGAGATGNVSSARSRVAALNPGHAFTETIPAGDGLTVVLSSPTDYQADLSTEQAGRKDALAPGVISAGPRLHDAAMRAIKDVFS